MQIHVLESGKVLIYSRNAENTTPRYPDILAALPNWLAPSTKSIVIDGEAVAWDPEQKKILPFQVCVADARASISLQEGWKRKGWGCRSRGGGVLLESLGASKRLYMRDQLLNSFGSHP